MSSPSEKHNSIWHRCWHYWRRVINDSASDVSPTEAISEITVGVVIAFINPSESGMIFEVIAYALGVPLFAFVLRCLFVTPATLYSEIEGEVEILESKIAAIQSIKPLELESIGPKKPSLNSGAEIRITNPNQPVAGVELRLMKIDPPLKHNSGTQSTEDMRLSAIRFAPKDISGDSLKAGQSAHFDIFEVQRKLTQDIIMGRRSGSGETTLRFIGRIPESSNNDFAPEFQPSQGGPLFKPYILTFETSAIGVPVRETQFRLIFSSNPLESAFSLEKIAPDTAAPARKIRNKKERRKESASVGLLLCISAAFAIMAGTERFQISKLKNPPSTRGLAAKLSPIENSKPVKVVTIPSATAPPSQSTPAIDPSTTMENFRPAESNNTNSLDIFDQTLLADKNKKEAERRATEAEIITNWTNALPYYREILISLRDMLYHRAETNGYTIGQPSNYFQSLPSTIDPSATEFNITQIGYQEDTNWLFSISVTSYGNYRLLRITSSSCWLEIFPQDNTSHLHRWFQFQAPELKGIHFEENAPIGQSQEFIYKSLKTMMDGHNKLLKGENIK